MRKVVLSVLVTPDGAVAGPGGDLSGLPFDEGFSARNVELLRGAGTLLLGRSTYEGFAAYWPQVLQDPAQPPVEQEIARINAGLEKVVISDSLRVDPGSAWAATTRVVPRAEAARSPRRNTSVTASPGCAASEAMPEPAALSRRSSSRANISSASLLCR